MQTSRGEIYNPERAKQLRDYSGLRFGNITPTDIDGIIEYKNIGYVIIELKYNDGSIPYGQRLALERITDDLEKAGKRSLCIIANHYTLCCDDDIDVANADVSEYRYKRKWIAVSNLLSTRDLITRFLGFIEKQEAAK